MAKDLASKLTGGMVDMTAMADNPIGEVFNRTYLFFFVNKNLIVENFKCV